MGTTVERNRKAGNEKAEAKSEPLITIGEVVRQLQGDFPGLSITKVRYL